MSNLNNQIDKSLSDGSLELSKNLEEIMSNIDKKLDTAHSIVLRLKATDENGHGKCPLCGDDNQTYYTLVCGHFIKRRHTRTRWSMINTTAICSDCNGKEEDTLAEPMRDYKVSTEGLEQVLALERQVHQPYKMTKTEKDTLLRTRRLQIRDLLKNKNFNITIP
jgi:hypothetical protein